MHINIRIDWQMKNLLKR